MDEQNGGNDYSSRYEHTYVPVLPINTKSEHESRSECTKQVSGAQTATPAPERPIPKPRAKVQKALDGDEDCVDEKAELNPSSLDTQSVVRWIKAWYNALIEKDESSCFNVDVPKLEGINMEEITEGFLHVLNRDRGQTFLIEEVHRLYRTVNVESEESGISSHERMKIRQKAEKKQREMEKKEKKKERKFQFSEQPTFSVDDHENVKSALLEIYKLQTVYQEMLKKRSKPKNLEVAKESCNCYEKINRLQLKLEEERQKVKDKDEICRDLNNKCIRLENQMQRIMLEKEAVIKENNMMKFALQEKRDG